MIDAIYATIIVVFASLGVLALFNQLVRGNEIQEAVVDLRTQTEQVEGRLAEMRSELEELKFDIDAMDEERVALEKQARCMLDLEERFKVAQAAALEGTRKSPQ